MPAIQATQFLLTPNPNVTYSACLVHGIEQMFQTRVAPYPIERTLLVSGILESCLTSKVQDHQRLETPELEGALPASGAIDILHSVDIMLDILNIYGIALGPLSLRNPHNLYLAFVSNSAQSSQPGGSGSVQTGPWTEGSGTISPVTALNHFAL